MPPSTKTIGHDDGGDAGDEQAVLDGGRAALVHLGEAGVEHDAEVVQHFFVSCVERDVSSKKAGGLRRKVFPNRPLLLIGRTFDVE